jgi:hypothetical protein
MRILYKQYEGGRARLERVDECCDRIYQSPNIRLSTYSNDVVVEIVVSVGGVMGTDTERDEVSYCPFCGEEVEYDSLGTFERKTVEKRVD